MAHRVNVMLEDSVWEQLQKIPQGERSKMINQSLSETLLQKQRSDAFARLRNRSRSLSTKKTDSTQWLCQDRKSH